MTEYLGWGASEHMGGWFLRKSSGGVGQISVESSKPGESLFVLALDHGSTALSGTSYAPVGSTVERGPSTRRRRMIAARRGMMHVWGALDGRGFGKSEKLHMLTREAEIFLKVETRGWKSRVR